MKKRIYYSFLMFFVICLIFVLPGCGNAETEREEQSLTNDQEVPLKEENEIVEQKNEEDKNREIFFQKASERGIAEQEAEVYFQKLSEGDVLKNEKMEITGLIIEDMDENGLNDMMVMLREAEADAYEGGAVYFYMNEDAPYCFTGEFFPYHGWFNLFWEDLDNDGYTELVLEAVGTGTGAVGDHYVRIFKYQAPGFERMELPSDIDEELYYTGIEVEVYREPEKDTYLAYSKLLDESIAFRGYNIEGFELPAKKELVGGNARGFYDLRCVEYKGKNALQASEYLSAEGGTMHGVASAEFIITWNENGESEIAEWWIASDYPEQTE